MAEMSKKERTRQDVLDELARKFRDSAEAMQEIAARIQAAAEVHRRHDRRMARAEKELGDCVGSKHGPLPFSYLEYVEFESSDEFKRFKEMPVVSAEEIAAVDWEKLADQLLGE